MKNPYVPIPMRVKKVVIETEDRNIKTFSLSFVNERDRAGFDFKPGQFVELSVLGKGEAPFGIASSPMDELVELTVNKIGVVTKTIHEMEEGDSVGIRGPLGNGYPLDKLKGKSVVIVGGGFGFSTLRALINYMTHPQNRQDFGDISVFYGARTPGLLLYKDELERWAKQSDLNLYLTVDRADDGWKGKVGVVPAILKEAAPAALNACALVCGPPVMIKFTLPVLSELGFTPERILLSLEMRMKCGLGKCGRCNIGSKYVCKDGPVFTLEELNNLPPEY